MPKQVAFGMAAHTHTHTHTPRGAFCVSYFMAATVSSMARTLLINSIRDCTERGHKSGSANALDFPLQAACLIRNCIQALSALGRSAVS